MSDLEKFNELVDDIWEMVFGTPRKKLEEPEYTNVSKGFTKNEVKAWKKYAKTGEKPKRKRSRKKDGTYRGDDKSTPNINEAWENE